MKRFSIQFLDNDRILIRGGDVSVKGQILQVDEGVPWSSFLYHPPEEQVAMFGHQAYVLLEAYDDETGKQIKHEDIGRTVEGAPAFIRPEDMGQWPGGVHDVIERYGAPLRRNDGSEPEFRNAATTVAPTRKKKLLRKRG